MSDLHELYTAAMGALFGRGCTLPVLPPGPKQRNATQVDKLGPNQIAWLEARPETRKASEQVKASIESASQAPLRLARSAA